MNDAFSGTVRSVNALRGAAGRGAGVRQPARVHHVVLSLEPGGLENGVVNVINGLDAERFESSVCCLDRGGEFVQRIQPGRAIIYEMNRRRGRDLRLPFRLAEVFRRSGAQIVHTRNAEAFFYGFLGAKLARVPALIHSEHGRTFNDRRARFLAQRAMTHFTDAVFAVSEQLKIDLNRHVGISLHKIDVLYNGVDLDRFGGEGDRPSERATLGVSGNEVLIGTVGRLAPVKNQALLLRAVEHLPSNVRAVIVGDGPQAQPLRELAASLGISDRVNFLGHSDHVARLLPAFDIFALPSLSEGMSNTLLEAMAAGVAPVVSDVGGNPEIVRDGREGLVFPNDDEAALVQQLRRLCSEPELRRRLAGAAQERVMASFGIQAMVQRYESLYERVLARCR